MNSRSANGSQPFRINEDVRIAQTCALPYGFSRGKFRRNPMRYKIGGPMLNNDPVAVGVFATW